MRSRKRWILVPAPSTQARSRRLTVIRWIYLGAVAIFALWLVDLLVGDRIFFRAQGLVLSEEAMVAGEFPLLMQEINVKEGEYVAEGQPLAKVSSKTLAADIIRLRVELATRKARETELRIRSASIETMLDITNLRQSNAAETRKTLESLRGEGHLGILPHASAVEGEYRGVRDLETLKLEKQINESELAMLEPIIADVTYAIEYLGKLHANGELLSPMDGVVVRIAASRGSVVQPGTPIFEIYAADRYVLAYVNPGGLFELKEGRTVKMTAGLDTTYGTITKVKPMAAALPREFQRAFAPVERQQLLQIEFAPGNHRPPLFTKVSVRYDRLVPYWIDRECRKLMVAVATSWRNLLNSLGIGTPAARASL